MMITGKDIHRILDKTLSENKDRDKLTEAFVSQPKKFDLTTDSISQKAKSSHKELYERYIERFNKISSELDSVDKDVTNIAGSKFRSLKMDETYNLNAIYLHELYFNNIADTDSEVTVDSLTYMRLTRDFGTFDNWQRDFIACAMSARNGWVVTAYNVFLQSYVNIIIDSHDHGVMIGSHPVIVIDMWEHAYFEDNQNDKKNYLFSMLKELNWEVIENRFKRMDNVAKIVKL